MLLQPADVVFAFCPTGEGGGVDPTCSPANAGAGGAGGGSARRAQVAKSKADVLKAAQEVEIKVPTNYDDYDEWKENKLNAWVLDPESDFENNYEARYNFETPKGRKFAVIIRDGEVEFHSDSFRMSMTGEGEAHYIFSEVAKATLAFAKKTDAPLLQFSADVESLGRQKLYSRLASSLAELVPGAKAKINNQGEFGVYYKVKLQDQLPEGVVFAFCPTGEGGGVDPTCSPGNAGSAAPRTRRPRQRRPGQPLRVNEWPEVDRRKLRALQSRLSRAVGEPAKAAVRAQIEALRARVQAIHDQLNSPTNSPENIAAAAARAAAAPATRPAGRPWPPQPAAPKVRTQAEIEAHLANLTDAPEYDEGWRPLTQQLEQLYESGGEAEAGSTSNRTQLDAVMASLFGSKGEDRANHAKLLLSAVGADKRITDRLNRADVQALAIGRTLHTLTLSLRGDGVAMTRVLRNNSDGKSAENALFTLSDNMQGDGTGVRVFSQQVDALTAAGFKHVETTAARGGSYIGYKVWPKFGYDGELNSGQVASAKSSGVYKDAYTDKSGRAKGNFQATLETKEGQAWWTKYGEGKHLYFRLDDKKHASHQILKSYRDNKIQALKKELETAPATAPAAAPAAAPASAPASSYTSLSPEQGERIRAAAALRMKARRAAAPGPLEPRRNPI